MAKPIQYCKVKKKKRKEKKRNMYENLKIINRILNPAKETWKKKPKMKQVNRKDKMLQNLFLLIETERVIIALS